MSSGIAFTTSLSTRQPPEQSTRMRCSPLATWCTASIGPSPSASLATTASSPGRSSRTMRTVPFLWRLAERKTQPPSAREREGTAGLGDRGDLEELGDEIVPLQRPRKDDSRLGGTRDAGRDRRHENRGDDD